MLRKAVVRRDSFQGSQFAIKGQGNELYQVQIDIPSIVTCIQDGSSDYGFHQVLLQLEVTCISEPDVGSVFRKFQEGLLCELIKSEVQLKRSNDGLLPG